MCPFQKDRLPSGLDRFEGFWNEDDNEGRGNNSVFDSLDNWIAPEQNRERNRTKGNTRTSHSARPVPAVVLVPATQETSH